MNKKLMYSTVGIFHVAFSDKDGLDMFLIYTNTITLRLI